MWNLKDKTVVITGATNGIGKAAAAALPIPLVAPVITTVLSFKFHIRLRFLFFALGKYFYCLNHSIE